LGHTAALRPTCERRHPITAFTSLHDIRGGHAYQALNQMRRRYRLRQHGTFLIFFTNMWLSEPHVREKETISSASSALPEAKPAFGSGTRMEQATPRNTSSLQDLRGY